MLRMRPTDEHGAEAINGLMQLVKDGASLVRFEGVLNPLPILNDEEDDGKPAFDMTAFKAGPSARLTAADFLAGGKPPPPPAQPKQTPPKRNRKKLDDDDELPGDL